MSRNTHQKEVIRRIIMQWEGHPTADEVYFFVRQELPTISRATVYRVLNRLVTEGVLKKHSWLDRAELYDHRLAPHYHIRCEVCGALQDLEVPVRSVWEGMAQVSTDFLVTGHEMFFHGVCPKCKRERELSVPLSICTGNGK